MKRFVKINSWLLLVVAFFIVGAYFLPGNVHVERSATIEASPKTVYSQIIDLHCWNKWSEWSQLDPNMRIEYIKKGVGIGAGFIWESENRNVGAGTINIVEVVKYDSIGVEMNFMD